MLYGKAYRAAAVGLAMVLTTMTGSGMSAATPDSQVNTVLGLRASRLVSIDSDATQGYTRVTLDLDGVAWRLEMTPHSVRSDKYELLVQQPDGSLRVVEPGPVRTMRGVVAGVAGSVVAASVNDAGLTATIHMPGGDRWWVEPIGDRVPGLPDATYVLYHADDVLGSGGACATAGMIKPASKPVSHGGDNGNGGVAGGGPCIAELACDADFEYFQDYGSVAAVENRINSVINTVNLQYESQVGITHVITTIIVRSSEPDPYSGNDSDDLVSQFRSHWLANHAGVPRDVAHLFTGRTIQTPFPGIIGQAFTIGGICTTSAYCYSVSDCCGSFGCATDLTAHELGHLWDAFHCSCPSNTMNPSIGCANVFSAGTINSIVAHRDSRACLDDCDGGGGNGPANDDCADATPVGEGSFPFSNADAATDGPDESAGCTFFGYTQVDSDIWYRYTASCTGTATISLCGSGYDTKIAVYGSGCPGGSGQVIACEDDFCSLQSEVSLSVTAGQQYLVRIGGYQGATGSGTLTIGCVPSAQPECGDAGTGDCLSANGTPYCDDAACCDLICASDPFCCDTQWDQTCANSANAGCGPAGPANDDCVDAIAVGVGATAYSILEATDDGPALPGSCDEGFGVGLGSDVWFRHTPAENGTLTMSTCNQVDYDSRMAAYTGNCGSLTLAGCNDDGDGCGTSSELTIAVTCDEPVLIRVGGYNGVQGSGTLSLTMSGTGCGTPCPGDTNDDDIVNVTDLVNVVLDWGCIGVCLGDVNDDNVVDVLDLLDVILAWGPC